MILTINAGSSSLKYTLFKDEAVFKKGKIERIGINHSVLNHAQAWEKLYQSISAHRDEIKAVGHRVVHGGDKYRETVKISDTVLKDLHNYTKLAPLHMPAILEVISITKTVLSKAVHYAIFDTAFCASIPERASTYALPIEVRKKYNIKKYGFHGISHSYALNKAQEELGLIKTQRTVTVHLGAGSSVAAIKEGVCVDISLGFTPMEGLIMMTRCGDVDPGIILFLLREGYTEEQLDHMLNKESGLYGISGLSDDMRDLLFLGGFKVEDEGYSPPSAIAKDEVAIGKARLAIDMFVYRAIKYIGAYAAVLGGLDAIVFTGSIGAGSSEIRRMILGNLTFIKDYEVLSVEPNEEEEMMSEIKKQT